MFNKLHFVYSTSLDARAEISNLFSLFLGKLKTTQFPDLWYHNSKYKVGVNFLKTCYVLKRASRKNLLHTTELHRCSKHNDDRIHEWHGQKSTHCTKFIKNVWAENLGSLNENVLVKRFLMTWLRSPKNTVTKDPTYIWLNLKATIRMLDNHSNH